MAADRAIRWAARVALLAAAIVAVSHLAALRREAEINAAYPPIGAFVTVSGVDIHYLEAGSGPDLVLLHGAGANLRDMTESLVPALARRYHVVAFDRPAHGHSGEMPKGEDRSPRAQARLLAAAAERLGLRRPVVLGHSYGGAVALAWGLERPDMARALVIVSGASLPWDVRDIHLFRVLSSAPGRLFLAPVITAFFPNSLAADIIAEIFAPNPVPPDYAVRTGAALAVRRATLAADARQIAALPDQTAALERDAPGLRLPVEIVHGTDDRIVPPGPTAARLSRLVEGAHLVLLEDTGHMPHHVRRDAVLKAVDRAFRRAGTAYAPASVPATPLTQETQP